MLDKVLLNNFTYVCTSTCEKAFSQSQPSIALSMASRLVLLQSQIRQNLNKNYVMYFDEFLGKHSYSRPY